MNIEIRTHGVELAEELRLHAEERVRFSLEWARRDVRRVIINFTDINGPRGGNDKRCQLRIPLAGMRDVVIEDTAEELRVAVDRAIDRAARTLDRRLSRKREFGPLQAMRQRRADVPTLPSSGRADSQIGATGQPGEWDVSEEVRSNRAPLPRQATNRLE